MHSESDTIERGWAALKVPTCENDDFVAWFVYKPAYLGTVSSAAACVTLDCRAKRMRNGLKARFRCRKCPGRTGNVRMCSHVDFVLSSVLADTNASSEQDMNAIGMLPNGEVAVLSDA